MECLTAVDMAAVLKEIGVESKKARGKPPSKAQLTEALGQALKSSAKVSRRASVLPRRGKGGDFVYE